MSGKTIMPGMINAHAHLNIDSELKTPVRDQLVQRLRTYADYGVTTAVSLGSTPADELDGLKLRDEQDRGTLDRARIYTGGVNAVGTTPEEARKSVDRLADLKVDIIKYHINGNPNDMTPDVYGALVDESHKRGLRTAVHIFYLKDAMGALDKGTDIIAHSVRDQDVDQRLIATLKTRNVGYIPTLTRDLSVFVYETRPAFFDDPFFLRGIALYRKEVDVLTDPARQARIAKRQAGPVHQAGAAAGDEEPQDAVRCGRADRDGHRQRRGEQPGPMAGLLRARGARIHGPGRHDADAGARRRDRRRGARDEARRRGHDSARKMGGSAGPERGPARRHPEHASDPLGLDRRPSSGRRAGSRRRTECGTEHRLPECVAHGFSRIRRRGPA